MEILRCEGIQKVYGSGNSQVVALRNVDLSVEKGEFVAIVGASGSGKSTLLHLLGSVDKPTEGKVIIEGTDISTLNQTRAAIFRRRKVGLIYQFYNLIPTLTIRKNILMPLLLDKKKPNQEYFEQIVRSLGIADKLESLPNQLSGGQQQRAAIARSLLYRPALLLADEPTGNLDQKNTREIFVWNCYQLWYSLGNEHLRSESCGRATGVLFLSSGYFGSCSFLIYPYCACFCMASGEKAKQADSTCIHPGYG